jgi:hypothetical protein
MTSFTHKQHDPDGKVQLSVSFKTKDPTTVSLFLLLGEEKKDGTVPLDLLKTMDEMGWIPKTVKFKHALVAAQAHTKAEAETLRLKKSKAKEGMS